MFDRDGELYVRKNVKKKKKKRSETNSSFKVASS